MEARLYTFPDLIDEQKLFEKNYFIEKAVCCPMSKMQNLKAISQRTCRFCSLSTPHTTFSNDAHTIPELLGNRYLISDSECDKCNVKFGKYEHDLASFLGAYRTILGVKKKKNKFPAFHTPGDMLVIKRTPLYGIKDGVNISLDHQVSNLVKVNDSAGTIEMTYKKRPYVPLNVYKALLKIALSILPDKYINDYHAFTYLDSDEVLKQFAEIFFYELPYEYAVKHPMCYMFKKLNPISKTTERIFALYFQNFIYQFPLHFHISDFEIGLYNGSNNSVPMCPPILFSQPDSAANYYRSTKDFSSDEAVTEDESIRLSFDPNSIRDMKVYDPETGNPIKITSLDDIVGMYIYSPIDKN